MFSHNFLTEQFPQTAWQRRTVRARLERQDDGRLVDRGEVVEFQDAVGEDIAEAEETSEHDYSQPTDSQKREFLKIHRNLGHRLPRELGLALRSVMDNLRVAVS